MRSVRGSRPMSAARTPATVVADPFELGSPAGAYRFEGDPPPGEKSGITMVCPCGCGTQHYLPFRGAPYTTDLGPAWGWDGNVEAPTLSPSVRMLTPCAWHGYLRAGFWESC